MKHFKELKTTTKYILLCLYVLFVPTLIYIGCVFVSEKINVDSPYLILYILVLYPMSIGFYGFISYILTKRILLPNLMLFLLIFLQFAIINIIDEPFLSVLPDLGSAAIASVAITLVSLFSSVIFAGADAGSRDKNKNSDKE